MGHFLKWILTRPILYAMIATYEEITDGEKDMSIFRFIWWAIIISAIAFAGYVYGYLSD